MSLEKKDLEDIVLVLLIIAGLIGCSFFFFKDGGKPLSAFFAAFALSCIVYRFLGGIAQESSFQMGFLKLGGSAAFIIAAIWFLNKEVFVARDAVIVSMPAGTRWYPVRMDTGNPDTVTILTNDGGKDSFRITEGDYETLKNNEYTLEPEKGNRFQVKKGNVVIGFVETTFSNKPVQIHEPDIFTLNPFGDTREFKSNKYPFTVTAEGGYFHVRRVDNNKPVCQDCADLEVIKKKHLFFEVDGNEYLCFVLQANYQLEQERWYSQFLVGRIDFKD